MAAGDLNREGTMTHAVYHSKSLFLVQTTHSAHIGSPFVLQGVTLFPYTVEKTHNRSEKSKMSH